MLEYDLQSGVKARGFGQRASLLAVSLTQSFLCHRAQAENNGSRLFSVLLFHRPQIWYNNVPHSQLANYKSDQNWLKQDGDRFLFPGGGTQFKHGATQYITWLQEVCHKEKLQ